MGQAARVAKAGSSAQGRRRMFSTGRFCVWAARSAVSRLGARTTLARCNASRRKYESGFHTSMPCVQMMECSRGRASFIARTTEARLGCAAITTRALSPARPQQFGEKPDNHDGLSPRGEIEGKTDGISVRAGRQETVLPDDAKSQLSNVRAPARDSRRGYFGE